jgi:hypothetical protein
VGSQSTEGRNQFPLSVVEAYNGWTASNSDEDCAAFIAAVVAAKLILSQGIVSGDVAQALRERFPRAVGLPAFEDVIRAPLKCPKCGLLSPESATTCDCGAFQDEQDSVVAPAPAAGEVPPRVGGFWDAADSRAEEHAPIVHTVQPGESTGLGFEGARMAARGGKAARGRGSDSGAIPRDAQLVGTAGWHGDPAHRHQHRYWDGSYWTDQVSDDGKLSFDRRYHPTPINPILYAAGHWGGVAVLVAGFAIAMLVYDAYADGALSIGIIGVSLLLALAGTLFASVYRLIAIYRCWAVLYGHTGRANPSDAIAKLFWPFYNFYWIFQAVRGLAVDANSYSREQGLNCTVNVGLATATCVLTFASGVPYLGVVIALFFVPVLDTILIYQLAKFLRVSLDREPSTQESMTAHA